MTLSGQCSAFQLGSWCANLCWKKFFVSFLVVSSSFRYRKKFQIKGRNHLVNHALRQLEDWEGQCSLMLQKNLFSLFWYIKYSISFEGIACYIWNDHCSIYNTFFFFLKMAHSSHSFRKTQWRRKFNLQF